MNTLYSSLRVGALRGRLVPPCADQSIEVEALTEHLLDEIIPKNPKGFTFDPFGWVLLPRGPAVNPALYMVSRSGHERVVSYPPDRDEILGWVDEAVPALVGQGGHIGGWVPDGHLYLDISIPVIGRREAEEFAMRNGQQAIYHPATDENISLCEVDALVSGSVSRGDGGDE